MSNTSRSKLMQTSRNQWLATKDGAVVMATNDVLSAYAHGFSIGRDHVTWVRIEKMAGKSLLGMFMVIGNDCGISITKNKQAVIDELNSVLGTGYAINHLNSFISGLKPVPKNMAAYMRVAVMRYIFGDDISVMLAGALK